MDAQTNEGARGANKFSGSSTKSTEDICSLQTTTPTTSIMKVVCQHDNPACLSKLKTIFEISRAHVNPQHEKSSCGNMTCSKACFGLCLILCRALLCCSTSLLIRYASFVARCWSKKVSEGEIHPFERVFPFALVMIAF